MCSPSPLLPPLLHLMTAGSSPCSILRFPHREYRCLFVLLARHHVRQEKDGSSLQRRLGAGHVGNSAICREDQRRGYFACEGDRTVRK